MKHWEMDRISPHHSRLMRFCLRIIYSRMLYLDKTEIIIYHAFDSLPRSLLRGVILGTRVGSTQQALIMVKFRFWLGRD